MTSTAKLHPAQITLQMVHQKLKLSRNRALEITALIIARLKEHETKSKHKYSALLFSPTAKDQNTHATPTRFDPRTVKQNDKPSCNLKHTWIRCNDLTSTNPIDRGPSLTMAIHKAIKKLT
jgi:hypothetical protein